MDNEFLRMQDIVVRFGSLVANDHINLEVKKNQVHALLGENGAGKSTLMKVLAGLLKPRYGEIHLEGQKVEIHSPEVAMHLGIGMVHQHFMLIPTLTVAENVCLGLKSVGYPFPNLRKVRSEVTELAEKYGLGIDPQVKVADLSVGAQQRVEIIKALYRGARLLILDEPTSVLTPQETEGLFQVVNSLVEKGTSIIFISHKLNEVMSISNEITVLRQGKVVTSLQTKETSPEELARLMVGHEIVGPKITRSAPVNQRSVAKIQGLEYTDQRNLPVIRGIDLDIYEGEIHGIAGVDGNGQDEFSRILAGLIHPNKGKIILNDKDITRAKPMQRIKDGMAHIPGDRQHIGLIMDFSVAENCYLVVSQQPPYSRWGLMNYRETNQLAEDMVKSYDIRCRDTRQIASTLSGGNQQKLVLARELFRKPNFIIAMQPTHGLDVGATEYVHNMLIAQRDRGAAILLISTELDEITALSDRISVMYEGQIMGTVSRGQYQKEQLGLWMAGKRL
ncbi:MAG TPA: ABC transporter ATP-binding protein [Anaerolineaceae bacterium]|nr:ABC transporter ATP-binding protein [Anaerolineaceae bacterium]